MAVKKQVKAKAGPAEEKAVSSLSDLVKLNQQNLGINVAAFDYTTAESTLSNLAKYNPWWASSVRAIVRNSIQPQLKYYNPKGSKKEQVEELDMQALMDKPHPLFTFQKFISFNVFYNFHSGVAYNYIIRGTNGKPIALQPLPSELVKLDPNSLSQGMIRYQVIVNNATEYVEAKDMLVWQDFEYITTYYQGTSRLKHLLFTIINKNMADRYNKASFENGGEIKGVMTTPNKITKEDAKQIGQSIREQHGGADAAGKTLVLGNGTTYAKTGQTNVEMGFEQLQNVSKEEVKSVCHVPDIEMGGTSANYATAKEERKIFWETMMIPLMDSFATVLTQFMQKEFGSKNAAFWDYSAIAVLQQDINTKLQSALLMQSMGYDNEVITDMFDLPELSNYEYQEPPTPAIETPKTLIKSFSVKNDAVYNVYRETMKAEFLKAHRVSEQQYELQLRKYFFRQRNEVLDFFKGFYGLKADKDPLNGFQQFWADNISGWDRELEAFTQGYFISANKTNVKQMVERYGLKYSDTIKSTFLINNHTKKITQINETTNDLVYNKIKTALDAGLANKLGPADIASSILDSVRAQYVFNEKRALLIARTETTSVTNDLVKVNFEENGVEKKEWLTAGDESVRGPKDSFNHKIMDEVSVNINEYFLVPGLKTTNQMMHPGDMVNGEAGNVCNCRCTLLPK